MIFDIHNDVPGCVLLIVFVKCKLYYNSICVHIIMYMSTSMTNFSNNNTSALCFIITSPTFIFGNYSSTEKFCKL